MDSCRDSVIKVSAGLRVQVPDRPGSKVVESVEKQAQGHHGRDYLGDGSEHLGRTLRTQASSFVKGKDE